MNNKGYSLVELLVFIILLLGTGGWIANVVKLIGMINQDISTLFILRIVGIFLAPFGCILGYF